MKFLDDRAQLRALSIKDCTKRRKYQLNKFAQNTKLLLIPCGRVGRTLYLLCSIATRIGIYSYGSMQLKLEALY